MEDAASNYFVRLGRVLTEVVATDMAGASIGVDAAVARVTGLTRVAARDDRKLLLIGNGGSAAIASHLAIDYWKNCRVRALAFNDASLLTAVANDCGYPQVFAEPVAIFADPGDLLIAVSSSGASPNILNGVGAARRRGCAVITLSGFSPANELRQLGDLNFYVPADRYGLVELAHLAILHYSVDLLLSRTAPADIRREVQPLAAAGASAR